MPEWKDALKRDGFVHIPGVLDAANVEELFKLSLHLVKEFANSDDLVTTAEGIPVKLLYPLNKHPKFISALGRKEMRGVVDSLIPGACSVLTWEDILIKVPFRGVEVGVHQDIALDTAGDATYSIGIPLNSGAENPVCFLPGSHRFGRLTKDLITEITKECMEKFETIVTQPGDIVIHDTHTLHYSGPNVSEIPRATWYLEFRSMKSLLERGPWPSDWTYQRRAIWIYARRCGGESGDFGRNEPDEVKGYIERLENDQSGFRVPHVTDTVRYDQTSPYNHFSEWSDDWKTSIPAPDGTHHIGSGDGRALYRPRYDAVLPFHEPGLAPVRYGGESFHIFPNGNPAYPERFSQTFGFYETLAAIRDVDEWFHLRPSGCRAYKEVYAWCGNFQGDRCTVRGLDHLYLHITPEGRPAYEARWRYAGDFRDGLAVVQSDDGRSTHIDPHAKPVHGHWFLDLDVFHKGCARARDDDGWMHINLAGHPLYRRRFAAVEPFYNGQARVERFDGGLEVIDERGVCVVELRPALKSEFAALSDDLAGFWRTQAICTAVELGVFEALPATAAGIAETCVLEPARAWRLLRALAELRLVAYEGGGCSGHTNHAQSQVGEPCPAADEGGTWRATERGACLTFGHPWTLADAAIEYGRSFPAMWEALPCALGVDSGWRAPDVFAEVAADPARVISHHRMLASYALHDYATVPAALGLRAGERVIDAGGGFGALAGLLVEACPGLQVTVLDRPEVVERSVCGSQVDDVTFRAVDLFGPWGVEGDAVTLARVLHDWDDADALRILRRARRALPGGGRLFVVEMVLPEDGSAGGLCDLHLLAVTGGRERTVSEYVALLDRAGFVFDGVRRLPALPSIVVGVVR